MNAAAPTTTAGSAVTELEFQVQGMDCADCALTLEHSISQIQGVELIRVNFATATLQARGTLDAAAIVKRVHDLGYSVTDQDTARTRLPARTGGVAGFLRYLIQNRTTTIALIGAVLLLTSIPLSLLSTAPAIDWGLRAAHIAIMVSAGYPIARKGIRALFFARQITIDLLMLIAATGALLIGETGEAATVIVLFAIGEALEGYSSERARDALKSLLALRPDQATVLRPCIDCAGHMGQEGYSGGPCPFCPPHEVTVPVEDLELGETVIVRPGEHVPIDGQIASGTSSINQAPVTGESVPVLKSPGEHVYAGTINGEAALEVRVTHLAQDSTINRIVRLVEQAQAQRAPVERYVDRFARWYTPAAVLTAILVAAIPPLVFGAPFLDTADGTRGWLYRALSLLLVGCPCALVISTPVTMVSAMSALARRGVLVKGGAFLDALARIKTFALDKTGTLTQGRPTVIKTLSYDCSLAQSNPDHHPEQCETCDEMLALAATVERRSEHPLAQAILSEARKRDILHRYPAAETVQALAGQGIEGTLYENTVTVGSHTLFHERAASCEDFHDQIHAAEQAGQTVILVGKDNEVLGLVGVADEPRETTRDALYALKETIPGVKIAMLTGDSPAVADRISERIGAIDQVYAGLLPHDKLSAIQNLQRQYGQVAMIGDGVNDAPALAAADVGIAMGGAGTAQAMETADVVLMQDDLTHLNDAVRTSRQARRVIQQNIAFSLAIKAAVLVLAMGGWATLWMAVIADVGASLSVTLNGMRLLKS